MQKIYYPLVSRKTIRLHGVFWLLFIAYEVLVTFSYTGKFAAFHTYIGAYLLNICLFYVNTYFVLSRWPGQTGRSYVLLFLLVLSELALYILLKWCLAWMYVLTGLAQNTSIVSFRFFIIEGVWRAVYFIGLSTAYWFSLTTFKHQRKIAKLENRELRSQLMKHKLENAYLQAQINPHFLFNTLNFLYNTVSKVSDKASKTVLLLSDMMRYALDDVQDDGKVDLDEELSHIRNFIQLAQLRHEDALSVEFVVQGDTGNLRIIPLALMTIVENVFKYADLKDPQEPALIQIAIQANTVLVDIRNKKRAAHYPHSHGIGISNVKKRLDKCYGNNYSLTIRNDEDSYNLHLTINL